jgi:iron(III) transport system substrate-binding protein
MRSVVAFIGATAIAFTAAVALPARGVADELPKATQDYLKTLNLPGDLMNGLDQELAVPKEWVDAATKEGTVKVAGEWDNKQFVVVNAPFAERYPQIKVVYSEAKEMNARAVAPLVAFKQGQYLTDVIMGFGGAAPEFEQANALEDVTELPGFKNQVDGANDPGGKWAALRLRYWCIGYNTQLVKKSELPKTWDDLLTSPALQNGNLGIGNRPQLWLLMLRTEKGKEWTENFLKAFFTTVKPQLRTEAMPSLIAIMAAGEVHAALPTAEYNIKEFEDKGAPVGWHCPEPVPLSPSQLGIMNGNPHPNAARLWTNWMLSREAQLAQFIADGSPPSNKALQRNDFLAYPDQVVGRHLVQADQQYNREVFAMWNQYWK